MRAYRHDAAPGCSNSWRLARQAISESIRPPMLSPARALLVACALLVPGTTLVSMAVSGCESTTHIPLPVYEASIPDTTAPPMEDTGAGDAATDVVSDAPAEATADAPAADSEAPDGATDAPTDGGTPEGGGETGAADAADGG